MFGYFSSARAEEKYPEKKNTPKLNALIGCDCDFRSWEGYSAGKLITAAKT
jgi:hypothetical protein